MSCTNARVERTFLTGSRSSIRRFSLALCSKSGHPPPAELAPCTAQQSLSAPSSSVYHDLLLREHHSCGVAENSWCPTHARHQQTSRSLRVVSQIAADGTTGRTCSDSSACCIGSVGCYCCSAARPPTMSHSAMQLDAPCRQCTPPIGSHHQAKCHQNVHVDCGWLRRLLVAIFRHQPHPHFFQLRIHTQHCLHDQQTNGSQPQRSQSSPLHHVFDACCSSSLQFHVSTRSSRPLLPIAQTPPPPPR